MAAASRRAVRWRRRLEAFLLSCTLLSALQYSAAFIASSTATFQRASYGVYRYSSFSALSASSSTPSPQRRRRQQTPATSTGRKLTPAEELQYASSPEDILSCAARYASSGSLKPAHLSQAVLRIGRALVQPKDAGQREAMRKDPRMEEVLSAWQASSVAGATARQHSDLLLGLALLDYKPPPAELLATTIKVLEGSAQGRAQHQLNGEDVSNVAWSLERLGVPQLLPQELRDAMDKLPFKVLQGALADERLEVQPFIEEVQWRQDIIRVAGKEVEETRLTAWQGPRPFYYSGKEMGPAPMTATVARVRDVLHEKTGLYFDCVLLNLYLHGRVAMSWHIDPDQGVLWTNKTAVVSIGDSRYFLLRRIADNNDRHRFLVSGGDVVLMLDDCQEVFQHCVRKEDSADEAGPRISLVFKQSLDLNHKDP